MTQTTIYLSVMRDQSILTLDGDLELFGALITAVNAATKTRQPVKNLVDSERNIDDEPVKSTDPQTITEDGCRQRPDRLGLSRGGMEKDSTEIARP